MEDNSNSSSTNSHSDENKPPAGDPNALPTVEEKNAENNGDSVEKTAEKRKAEEDVTEPIPVSAEKIAKLKESEPETTTAETTTEETA